MQTKLPVVICFRLSFLYDNQHTIIIAHVSMRFEGICNEALWPLVLGEQPPPNPWSSVPRLWGDQATKRSWNELERHLIAPGNLPFVIPSISSNFMTSSKDSLPPKDTDWYFLRFAAEAGQAVQADVILTSKEVPLSNYICCSQLDFPSFTRCSLEAGGPWRSERFAAWACWWSLGNTCNRKESL